MSDDILRFLIARDVRVEIHLTGQVTQEAVQKMIDILECEKDTFTKEKEDAVEATSSTE